MDKDNFDNFITLLTDSKESEKIRSLDLAIIKRLREDAFSTNPRYEAYLGKIGNEWVAYFITVISYSISLALPSLIMDEIFVSEKFRSMGVGAAMLNFCIRKAKKRDLCEIKIAVPARNKKAKKFFEYNDAFPTDLNCYKIDPSNTKIIKSPGKMTYADFLRKKRISKISCSAPE